MAIPKEVWDHRDKALDVIRRLASEHSQAWRDAHNPSGGGAHTELFVRLVASALHNEVSPLFGLNGKRGDPGDISDDVVNYYGAGPGRDPLTNAPVTVIDFIRNAGASHDDPDERKRPEVVWAPIDLPGDGAWVKPVNITPPVAQPPVVTHPPNTDLEDLIMGSITDLLKGQTLIFDALQDLSTKVQSATDKASSAHYEALQAALRASEIKTQIENLPKPGVLEAPEYVGELFGRRITFKPVKGK
jgi:hypothetical protein